MGTLFVDKLDPQSGTSLEIGSSGDTVTVPSGATFNVAGTLGSALKNTPAFEAYLSSNQSVSDNTNTKAQFDTEVFDTDSCYDNSTNYRFTPTVAGKYFVYTSIRVQSTNNTQLKTSHLYIAKNGSNVAETHSLFWNSYIRAHTVIKTATIDMNGSSDYLEVFGYLDANDNNVTGFIASGSRATNFGAYKIIE